MATAMLAMLGAASCQDGDADNLEQQPQNPDTASGTQSSGNAILTFAASDGDASLQKTAYAGGTDAGKIIWQESDLYSILPADASENAQGSIKSIGNDASSCIIQADIQNESQIGY